MCGAVFYVLRVRLDYMRTRSAPCADALGIMCGRARHHARTRSASCADTLGTMHGYAQHHAPTAYRLMT